MAQALRFLDSFDHYADAQLTSKWTAAATFNAFSPVIGAYGRNGTNGYRHSMSGSHPGMTLTIPGGQNQEVILGCAYKFSANIVNVPLIWVFRDSGQPQVALAMDSNLKVLTGWTGRDSLNDGVKFITGTRVLQQDTWYSIEIYVKIATVGGRFVVKVNELTELDYTGNLNSSGNQWANQVEFGPTRGGDGGDRYLDDVFVATGGSSFYGDCRVEAIFPSAAGALSQFTPNGAGANYTKVNEVVPNEDTTYVSDSNPGDRDSYVYGNLSPASAAVKGIQFVPRARTDDEGTRVIRSFYRKVSTNTNYDSPNSLSLTSAYSIPVGDVMETDPSGGSWSLAKINAGAAQFGVKIES